jgi:hypothetical protein
MKGGLYISSGETTIDNDLQTLKESGVRLLYKTRKNSLNNLYFKAILCMIGNLTKLSCISYETSSGFIFMIKSAKSYFKKHTEMGEIDIYEILLKFSIVGNGYYEFHGYGKGCYSKETILEEVSTQQQIYNTSYINHFEITPAILDCTIINDPDKKSALLSLLFNQYIKKFESRHIIQNINDYFNSSEKTLIDSVEFQINTEEEDETNAHLGYSQTIINTILQLRKSDRAIIDIFKYLKQDNRTISIVSMEYAANFETLADFLNRHFTHLKKTPNRKRAIYKIYAYLFAVLLYIYITTGVIHYDLHLSNILIYRYMDKPEYDIKNHLLIIDFGIIDVVKDTSINERYLEFFDSIQSKTITNIQLVIDFFKTRYDNWDHGLILYLPNPEGLGGLFDIFSFFQTPFIQNHYFLELFQRYITDLLQNIEYVWENNAVSNINDLLDSKKILKSMTVNITSKSR